MNILDKSELAERLDRVFPFYKELREEDRTTFIRSSQQLCFKKGTNIHDGDNCTGVILINKGVLRVYMLSEDGKEITLYRLFDNDICILSASCVLDTLSFDVYVDAEEDCECTVIGGCALEVLSQRVPTVKVFMLETALSRFSDIMWVMQQILFMSMDKRLAIFLLDEAAKNRSDKIRLTHEQIAKYMGSAREVVSRMVKYFCSEGILSFSRSEGITITDKVKLRALTR